VQQDHRKHPTKRKGRRRLSTVHLSTLSNIAGRWRLSDLDSPISRRPAPYVPLSIYLLTLNPTIRAAPADPVEASGAASLKNRLLGNREEMSTPQKSCGWIDSYYNRSTHATSLTRLPIPRTVAVAAVLSLLEGIGRQSRARDHGYDGHDGSEMDEVGAENFRQVKVRRRACFSLVIPRD
jgi:hypothetical protein